MRYFTLEDAEAVLPQVRLLMSQLVKAKKRADQLVRQWRQKAGSLSVARRALLEGQIEFLAREINRAVERIEKRGCLVKDLDLGLLDFPARLEGREAHLCWRLGEPGIRYWHGLQEGYRGRRLLGRSRPARPVPKRGARRKIGL